MQTLDMMRALLSVGMNPAVPMAMLEAFGVEDTGMKKLTADDKRYLSGPIVVHTRGGLSPHHPVNDQAEMRSLIYMDRFDAVYGKSELPVGAPEICAVMYEASLEAPLGSTLSEIYIWASIETMSRLKSDLTRDELLRRLGMKSQYALTGHQIMHREPFKSAYLELAADIRRKVINGARTRQ